MEKTPLDQRFIANSGSELAEAYFDFAPASLRRIYHQQREASIAETRDARLPERFSDLSPEEATRVSFELFNKAVKGMAQPEIASEMRDRLVREIRRGVLVAYGVPEKPTPSHDYVEIPLTMLDPRFIKWGQNEIKNRNFEFRLVRVLKVPKEPAVREIPTAPRESLDRPKPAARRTGRPRVDPLIDQAIDALLQEDEAGETPPKLQLAKLHVGGRLDRIGERARTMFPTDFPSLSRPSRSKIIEAMQRKGLSRSSKV